MKNEKLQKRGKKKKGKFNKYTCGKEKIQKFSLSLLLIFTV